MPASRFRLHRYPWIDAVALVATVGIAFGLFHLTDSHPAALAVGADTTRFRADSAYALTHELTEGFGPRVTGTPSANRAAVWIQSRFDRLGLVTETRSFPMALLGRRVTGRNVVARSGGTEPGAIVLIAHYDGQRTSAEAAGDNAAGIGTLLELARVLELRGHRRPIIYVATDAKEWGSIGANRLARQLDADSVVAAISFDHIASGTAAFVAVGSVGQGPGYAPIWLRHLAEVAYAEAGDAAEKESRTVEWFGRTLRLSTTDQGPLVARGIAAINLGVKPVDEVSAQFIYHTPGDRVETLEPASFRMLGEGAERMIRAIDAGPHVTGPLQYFEIEEGHVVSGWALYVAAVIVFLPLAWATIESWLGALAVPAARVAIRTEVARAVLWWVIALAGLFVLRALARTPLLPRYEMYPATVRDPFLYQVRWPPIILTLLAFAAVTFLSGWLRRRAALDTGHPVAGRAASLGTLLVLAAIAVAVNPFAAGLLLLLPAWLWPWVGPSEHPLGGARNVMVLVVSALPFLLIPVVVATWFQIGPKVGWYMFLQAAYGAWSTLSVVMFLVAVAAAWHLLAMATTRLEPAAGD